jgi:hypothetical protein
LEIICDLLFVNCYFTTTEFYSCSQQVAKTKIDIFEVLIVKTFGEVVENFVEKHFAVAHMLFTEGTRLRTTENLGLICCASFPTHPQWPKWFLAVHFPKKYI